MNIQIQWSEPIGKGAPTINEYTGSYQDLIDRLANAGNYPAKEYCPWIKMATFGTQRSAGKSLRHDANVLTVTGIMGDYDGGIVSMQDAIEMLQRYQVRGLVYPSPSATAQNHRWRVVCLLGNPSTPEMHSGFVARLNGVLGGNLSNESFTLSQSYYYGRTPENSNVYRVLVTFDDPCEGTCIDDLDELDAIAIGKQEATHIDQPAITQFDNSTTWVPPETVRDLRSALTSLPSEDRGLWVDICHALKTIGNTGRSLWLEWSQTSEKYDPPEAARVWASCKPLNTSYKAVFSKAQAAGWNNPLANCKATSNPMGTDVEIAPGKKADKGSSFLVVTCGANLTPEPVQWLWQEWLALGKFHLLAGAPGQGKTTIAMSLAATVTIGGRWPDGSRCEAGNVLIWSGEDDYTDTLLPRLIAAGADRSRVFFIKGIQEGDKVTPFDPATDTPHLKKVIQHIGSVSLVVVDPVSTAVAGDSHKNTEVRRGLQPLVDLATSIKAALIGITHLSKGGQGSDPAQRVIGSIAFTAVARVVLVAARVKSDDGTDKRILARSKSNIGPDNGGFEYHLAQVEALPGIDASRIEWGQAVEGSARDLLTDPAEGDNGTDHADAVSILEAELTAGCWTNANKAMQPLKDAGFTKKQIWTASKKLNVVRTKGGMNGGWYWRLPGGIDPPLSPEDSILPEGSEDSLFKKVEPLESSGVLESSAEPFSVNLGNIQQFLNSVAAEDVEVIG